MDTIEKEVALTELVSRDESTTNFSWGNLGHVEDDNGRDETDTNTSDQTTSNNKAETCRSSLENASNNVDETSPNNGRTATESVSDVTGNQSTFRDMII